jgi:two-component system capsular synthesis response regulator RcsB
MFTKVLVAEDFESYNIAIAEALKSLEIQNISHASHCDDALLKIRRGIRDRARHELLISDLSFTSDQRKPLIDNGLQLIEDAKALDPDLKVIVFSVENRAHPVKHLLEKLSIDGYVLKGRNNISELRRAIFETYQGQRYISREIAPLLKQSLDEIDDFDLKILKHLSKGSTQQEISVTFRLSNITPNSVSSIEKRINRLKMLLGANNNVHLISIAKDLGLV